MKVYIVYKYDSIFDSDIIDEVFKDYQKALTYMKANNQLGVPEEYDVIE